MNSTERKAARYQRRKVSRNAQRDAHAAMFDNFDNIISANSLIESAKKSRRTIRFKASVQRYFMSLLRNIWNTRRKLKNGENVTLGFIVFTIFDRGKKRVIRSVHFVERVIQRALCDFALVPMYARSLIYDNGASLEGKGIHFAMQRTRAHLQKFFRANGFSNAGWVLLIDFTGYFDNIEHEPIRKSLCAMFKDMRIVRLAWQFIKAFGEKSLGIGSQVSQILAVAYPNAIDHYAKEVLRLKYYGRYMDDTYIIHASKAHLENVLDTLLVKYSELGIRVNLKKTKIVPVSHFTFLKVRYHLTGTGKVIMKPCRRSITKMRQKLKKFKRLVDAGIMTRDDVRQSYDSWKGHVEHMNAHRSVINMDRLYAKLFGVMPKRKRGRR